MNILVYILTWTLIITEQYNYRFQRHPVLITVQMDGVLTCPRQQETKSYDGGGMPEVRFFPVPFFFCRVTLIGSGTLAWVSIDAFCTTIGSTAVSG